MTHPNHLALLKRHPSLTPAQFSFYWLHTHAALVLPWALANGCVSYIQTHNLYLSPSLSTSPSTSTSSPADLNIADWDGCAELIFEHPPGWEESAKSKDFYRRVIWPDEKRFLVGEARSHAKFVDKGLVGGERVVIVENGMVAVGNDGRPVVDITEGMRVWDGGVVDGEEGGEG